MAEHARAAAGAARPIPVPDAASAGFWASAARHVLAMQRCAECGRFAYPPKLLCLGCGASEGLGWEGVSGRGRLRTWTVVHTAFLPGFEHELPYVVADVELVEQAGLRMVARLRGIAEDDLELGLPVEVAFEDLEPGLAIPFFEPHRGSP